MEALVNKIIEFSNVDGPGNRLSIFFQGCPFNCLYCHNPETINRCISCGDCLKVCPTNSLKIIDGKMTYNSLTCVNCDKCIIACAHNSSPKVTNYEVSQLIEIIKDNKLFIRGITVSGGECMEYPEFLLELFKEAKKLGLSCLIDSNGAYDFSKHQELVMLSDGVMLDVKAGDSKFHQLLTGCDNQTVFNNLKYLLEVNRLFEVRTVLLPNFDQENLITIKKVVKVINDHCQYKLIKYRGYGVRGIGVEEFGSKILDEKLYKKYLDYCRQLGQTKIIEI